MTNSKTLTDVLADITHRLDVLTAAVLSAKPVLSIEEAAAFTGMSKSYLYKLTSTQKIPHYKPRGKMVYFDRVELEAYLLQNKVRSESQTDRETCDHVTGALWVDKRD